MDNLLGVPVKILVADDDADSRRLLTELLLQWGHEAICAADGREGWERLAGKDAPRLLILDWTMPRISGVELCRRIRKMDSGDPHYIILLTSKIGPEDVVTALESGANDYVRKPCNLDELRARVQVGCRVLDLEARLRSQEHLQGTLEMAGAVCHEMNQPLQIILTCAESLSMDLSPKDPNYETFVMIQDAAKRIGDVTRRVMNITSVRTRGILNGEKDIIDLTGPS